MVILVAVSLMVLLVGAVFSVDVAYMHMVRSELRTATDAAARAGSETLARTQDIAQARAAAISVAEQNLVAGNGLSLLPEDIQLGSLTRQGERYEFDPQGQPLTAVRVLGRRGTTAADGAVSLFFAKLFSVADFEPTHAATAAANVRDVALVLDISGSMSESSGSGTRLNALKSAVRIFLDEIAASSPHTQISLTSYSTAPTKVLELTRDYASIRSRVDGFRASGMTAIGDALRMGSDSLMFDAASRGHAFKTIVLMTDGNHNTGPSPAVTVATARERGQTVHTITFSNGANQPLMQSVASSTPGGIHLHADGAGDLAAAFRSIARTLSVTLVE